MTTPVDRLASALADRYRIERQLGQGGMATVYLAEDLKHDRKVALKVLKPELAAAIGGERFQAEIRTTARLRHPHILPLFDSGEAGGMLYYVMPYVEGESLRQRLDQAGRLPLAEALRFADEVAEALASAHDAGVIHRDVKPENILLDGGHALVTDFGIARVIMAAADPRLTATGFSLGTPLYMSPEQSVGERSIDSRADVYSLACVLFEMLAGRPPFTGPSAAAILAQRLVDPPPRLSESVPDVPAGVEAAVTRALARDPAERHPTMRQFAAALATEPGKATAGPAEKSIAVLPFEDMSPEHDQEYFGDGIAEEIINALTRLEGLRVAARTSAFSFKGKYEDLRVVGEKLNVATVLEGSVRKAGPRLRVTAQLITAADGYHLWSERYDRDLTDIFAVQDEIAAAIAEKLQLTYVKPAAPQATLVTTPQVEAYDEYLKGRSLLWKRGPALRQALACFERAVARDPSLARAHAGVGDALWWLAFYQLVPRAEALDRARNALGRALELDPDCAEALGTKANIAFGDEWDVPAARRLWERALEADARLPEVRLQYLRVLAIAHEDDRVVSEVDRAIRDDPLNCLVHANAAIILLHIGRPREARHLAERGVELDPAFWGGHFALAWAALTTGDLRGALAAAQQAVHSSGRHPWPLVVLAGIRAGLGDARRAQAVYDELRARAIGDDIPSMYLSLSALALGRVDQAMSHAMQSVETRELVGPWMGRFPGIEPLQTDRHYPELLRKAGL